MVNAPIVTAAVAGATALVVALVTNYLTRNREWEGNWRRLQLDRYREFVAAVSGVEKARSTPEEHKRYADAINEIQWVASPRVLAILKRFLVHNAEGSAGWPQDRHDELYDELIASMRRDLRPRDKAPASEGRFWLQAIPRSATVPAAETGYAEGSAPRSPVPGPTSGT